MTSHNKIILHIKCIINCFFFSVYKCIVNKINKQNLILQEFFNYLEFFVKYNYKYLFLASKRLSDLIRRPYDLYRAGVLDEYFMGLMNQVAQAMDDSITQEVRQ